MTPCSRSNLGTTVKALEPLCLPSMSVFPARKDHHDACTPYLFLPQLTPVQRINTGHSGNGAKCAHPGTTPASLDGSCPGQASCREGPSYTPNLLLPPFRNGLIVNRHRLPTLVCSQRAVVPVRAALSAGRRPHAAVVPPPITIRHLPRSWAYMPPQTSRGSVLLCWQQAI